MNKFIKHSAVAGGLFIGMLGVSGQASAHLSGATTFDFSSGVFRDALQNQSGPIPIPGAVFSANGQDYIQDGVQHGAIGFGTAPGLSVADLNNDYGGGSSHVHGANTNGSRVSQLEADAGGAFFKLLDGDAFSIEGLDVASHAFDLVGGGTNSLTFRGYTTSDFSVWKDVTLDVDQNGALISSDFGIELGDATNGHSGTHLHLDDVAEFSSLYLFEYWFDEFGRSNDPVFNQAGVNLNIEIDNVAFNNTVSAVPVPAAAYLFGTALLGLAGARRKKLTAS